MTNPETLPYLSRRELESMSILTDQVVSTIERLIRVTAVCTAGLSAVAAKRLARPDSSVVAFDRIIIDDVAQESQMENPMVDLSLVQGDLTGLVTGAVEGRIANDERTAFIFRGFALGDLALATLAFQAYRQ